MVTVKISKIFKENNYGVSFEFFPPKTEEEIEKFKSTVKELAKLNPLYVSVTYGAAGSSQEMTQETVEMIKQETGLTVMPHLTCMGGSFNSIQQVLDNYKNKGYENIFALRGDLPKDLDESKVSSDFKYAKDLVRFIKNSYEFSLGVALHPEGHPESKSLEEDIFYTKKKIDAGAEFGITQMFFDNNYLYNYAALLRKQKIFIPIVPGIIPITDFQKIERFASLCKTTIPDEITNKMKSLNEDSEAIRKVGIDFSINQSQDLINNGYRYLHFYSLNKAKDVCEIVNALKF